MERHPYFDLWLHSAADLDSLLPAPLAERETLHEWPLSCVQRLALADGSRWIYKAQVSEGVEAAFYAAARSPILPACRSLEAFENTVFLLIEYIDAPLLSQVDVTLAEALAHADRLESAIAQITGDPPVYYDLGDFARWTAFADRACRQLASLIESGSFGSVPPSAPQALRVWSQGESLRAAFACTVLAHADLSAENVFVTPDGYRVFDWQYPRRLPLGSDRAALLESLDLDPRGAVADAIIGVMYFIRLAWFIDCQIRLIPYASYEADCSNLVERILST